VLNRRAAIPDLTELTELTEQLPTRRSARLDAGSGTVRRLDEKNCVRNDSHAERDDPLRLAPAVTKRRDAQKRDAPL
jgi:hypothetical protein